MRQGPHVAQGPRHGNYPQWNHVPSDLNGTYRMVHQEHALPDPGAQNVTYSTFMFPVQDLYGAGMPLTHGTPNPCEPAQDMLDLPQYILAAPQANQQGTLTPMPLLPSDLVDQFSGKSV